MSKDIWHTADGMPPEDSYIVVKLTSGKCEVGFEFEYDFDNIEKWAFFDDLLACEQELIRTRKALEIALDWLEQVATPEKCDDDLCREFTKRKLTEIKTALKRTELENLELLVNNVFK